MDRTDRIFVGTFTFTTDDFLLKPPGPVNFIDVTLEGNLLQTVNESGFNHKMVSIFGRMGERVITGSVTVPSLIAKQVVTQQNIAVRAFEISQSGGSGSALDNWLRAERELLGLS
jgi:hypothetical protein